MTSAAMERLNLSEYQMKVLEDNFKKVSKHPDGTTLLLIAAECGLSEEETQLGEAAGAEHVTRQCDQNTNTHSEAVNRSREYEEENKNLHHEIEAPDYLCCGLSSDNLRLHAGRGRS
ncbi:Homeodomain-only protein [Nibea albiflora]|uniref:Homeodomain-only protein n=1 Tax=Nibea albiflora TaxID=240163 RepID=A0ACB7ER06_NIBAL|nr:Homeodomain-only protein [Nibea albiflora]